MKKLVSAVSPLAAIASLALTGAAWGDDFGCSNAVLNGAYAFGFTAYTPAGLPTVGTGIKVFDGNGSFTQRDYGSDRGLVEFSPPGQERGTYTVNPDCTGSMVINFNTPGVPAGLSSGVIKTRFVISDGGRHIHEVVAQLIPPFSSAPAPTATSADDWKVASEQDPQQ